MDTGSLAHWKEIVYRVVHLLGRTALAPYNEARETKEKGTQTEIQEKKRKKNYNFIINITTMIEH